jgi:hypothetical protein
MTHPIIILFAIFGIIWVSSAIVIQAAKLIDKIRLFGLKDGFLRWIAP